MRYIIFPVLLVLSLIIIRINIKLHSENFSKEETKEDIILQLNFLEDELKYNGLGNRMQSLFPEGYVFVNALYGLAWCELTMANQDNPELRSKAIDEALYAYRVLDSQKARLTFPGHLNPENGIFYEGWRNYLLSKIMLADTSVRNNEKYLNKFKNQSNSIAKALINSHATYLESYSSQAWPADMFVAMASLSNYNKAIEDKYSFLLNDWINKVIKHLDPATGIIPHKVDPQNAKTIQGSRGCSIGLTLRMLIEIDKELALQQFDLVNSQFISKTFGLPSVREYPRGTSGSGDIDSGPVIFGVGFSATIVMIGTLSLYGNYDLANQQYKTIHAFGFDRKTKTQKKYLFGKLPMADAFIAWGRATALKQNIQNKEKTNKSWTIKFHFLSLILLIFSWIIFFHKKIWNIYKTGMKKKYK